MKHISGTSWALAFGFVLALVPGAQADSTATPQGALRLYIDCIDCSYRFTGGGHGLEDFFRQEFPAIDYVRDRHQADVHFLLSWQRTGSGGVEYTMEFIGQDDFAAMRDTLIYVAPESNTEDITRNGLLHTLKLGLVRYLARTPQADELGIQFESPPEAARTAERTDPWNYWVFELGVSSFLQGQEGYQKAYVWGHTTASRTTEAWKHHISISASYDEQEFDYGSVVALSIQRSRSLSASSIKSLSDHWSAGLSYDLYSSTYSNLDASTVLGLGVEYNFFPYSVSARRMLRLGYWLRPSYMDYEEETIYFKTSQWLVSERLSVSLDLIEPWGSISSQLTGRHYFHDFEKYRVWWWNQVSVRLVKGLSFNVSGQMQWIYDQISLPRGDASSEVVLLRQRELETSYSYHINFGVSYLFGSIYNNIVNRRFGG